MYESNRDDIACRRCGVIGQHVVGPPRGVHHGELLCESCGAHIKWVSAKSPEERAADRAKHRDSWMSDQPPTERQINYLKMLGYQDEQPQNRLQASQLIEYLKREGL